MRISVFIGDGPSGKGVNGLVDAAITAEQLGFDGIWYPQMNNVDVLTVIGLASNNTSKIQMGTAVIPIFTRHPLVMAQQAMTVQLAANGRLALGLGLSHKKTMQDSFGLKYENLAQHAMEYLSIINQLNESSSVDFTGQFYRAEWTIDLPAFSKFPVLFAALGPRMLDAAGKYADGTITWMAGPKVLERDIVPKIQHSTQISERPSPKILTGIPIAITNDIERAKEAANKQFSLYKRLPSYKRLLDLENASCISDIAIIGNKTEVKKKLEQYQIAGATEILAMAFPVGTDHNQEISETWNILSEIAKEIN